MRKYFLAALSVLSLMATCTPTEAIQPRGEGSENPKYPLIKKLGDSPVFKAQVRRIRWDQLLHDHPPQIFNNPKDPKNSAVDFIQATGAHYLHKMGYKGKLPGKSAKIAVIDDEFRPDVIIRLARKGGISDDILALNGVHPEDVRENLQVKDIDKDAIRNERIALHKKRLRAKTEQELDKMKEDISRLEDRLSLKVRYDDMMANGAFHGHFVLNALLQIAPEATFLPIPHRVFFEPDPDDLCIFQISKAISTAIRNDANILNLSIGFKGNASIDLSGEHLAEACNRGTLIFQAAGNESTPSSIDFIRPDNRHFSHILKFKGYCTVGSTTYNHPDQRPEISSFSTVSPKGRFENLFLMAPGDKLKLDNKRMDGTSFSCPIAVGAFVLLKEYAVKNQIPFKDDQDLLNVLRLSGTPVTRHPWKGIKLPTYRTVNLVEACRLLDDRILKGQVLRGAERRSNPAL